MATKFCNDCNKNVSKTNYYTHIKTELHKRNVKHRNNGDILKIDKNVSDIKSIKLRLIEIRQLIDDTLNIITV